MHLYLTSKLRVIRKAHVISSCIIPVAKAKLKTLTTSKQQWRFFFLRKTVFIVTGTNRALVTGFFLFVTWKKENIWNMERSDRYLLKRYEKIHWYFVCKLEYRFSRILTREEPIWGLKRVFKRSTVFKHSSRSVDVILWRIRLLVFVTLVTWSKLVEHSAIHYFRFWSVFYDLTKWSFLGTCL